MAHRKYSSEQLKIIMQDLFMSASKLAEVIAEMERNKIKELWFPWVDKHISSYNTTATMGNEAKAAYDEHQQDMKLTGVSRRDIQANRTEAKRKERAKKRSP